MKRIMGLVCAVMVLSLLPLLTACGGGNNASSSSASSQAATQSESFGVKDGKFTCSTFQIDVPSGWTAIDMSEDSVKLVNAESEKAYDFSKNASVEISISAYDYGNSSAASGSIEQKVDSDKQFFKDNAPEISDIELAGYEGKLLVGESSTTMGCSLQYIDAIKWKEGTNDCSKMMMRCAFFNDAELDEIGSITDTLELKGTDDAEASSSAAASNSGKSFELKGATVTVPSGWEVVSDSSIQVEIKNPKFSTGSVTISCMSKTSNAATWQEKENSNYGGGAETWTKDINGATYYGVSAPGDTSESAFADCGDGCVVKVSTNAIKIDQIPEVLDGIKLK